MSSEQPYKSPSGLEPKKSNTVLIVVVVFVVLTISTLCVCGGATGFLLWTLRVESSQSELPVEVVPMEPPPPVEAVPPIEPASGDKPLQAPHYRRTLASC